MTFLKDMLSGGGGGGGGASIATDMFFASISARDTFTTNNPSRLYQGVACAVAHLTSYDYYQWDATGSLWRAANEIYQGQQGPAGTDGTNGTDGDPTTLINDSGSSTSKTFSSSKIDALFQSDGAVDNGNVTGLSSDFLNVIQQGKTHLKNWSTTTLPDLTNKEAYIYYFGASGNERFYLLATKSDGVYYYKDVDGSVTQWQRFAEINDTAINPVTTFSSNKITMLINEASQNELPTAVEGQILAGKANNQTEYIKASAVFHQTDVANDIAAVSDAPFDAVAIIDSGFVSTGTKSAGDTLILHTETIEEHINQKLADVTLSDEGDTVDGEMILGLTFTLGNGSTTKRTINIRRTSAPLPDLDSTTVVYGWTAEATVTESDIDFALTVEQSSYKTRTENLQNDQLATTDFIAMRGQDTTFKYFFVAHLTDVFLPEPSYLKYNGMIDTDTVVTTTAYKGKAARIYQIGDPTPNNVSTFAFNLVQV